MKIIENVPMEGMPWFDEHKWVSPMNFMSQFYGKGVSRSIYIHDVTLRDGEQTCGLNWTEQERVDIALALNDLGVKSIEVGMPIISEDISNAAKRLVKMNLRAEIVPFCRARKDDIEYAAATGVEKIIIEHAVNPYTNAFAYKVNTEKLIERFVSNAAYAKSLGLRVTCMGWDVTRTTQEYVRKVYKEVVDAVHPESIVFTDSFGVATPHAVYQCLKDLREHLNGTPIEFHVHNEFGMAMGSVMAAAYAGVSGIHSSINGLGERTGNVATEEVATALALLLNIPTGVNLKKIDTVTKMIEKITHIAIPRNKPVTGKRLFWLESGVVVHAKTRIEAEGINAAMAPYLPSVIGREPIKVVLGGSSGKESMIFYLEELKLPYTENDIQPILDRVKALGRQKRDVISDEEFLDIYKSVTKNK